MAWHYRDCDLGHGAWQAKQLHASLLQLSKRLPISVYAGDKVRAILCLPSVFWYVVFLASISFLEDFFLFFARDRCVRSLLSLSLSFYTQR